MTYYHKQPASYLDPIKLLKNIIKYLCMTFVVCIICAVFVIWMFAPLWMALMGIKI